MGHFTLQAGSKAEPGQRHLGSAILRASHLSKSIGGKELVKDINIHVKKGEIYGFLGPNGAGKTTVMRLLTNLWKPTSGVVELFGERLAPTSYEALKRIGSIIEFPCFYEHMSGKENLQLHCEYMGYYNPGSVEDALGLLGLLADADKPVKRYSLGMKQRLGIARAVLSRPELLILDEPANGLDPAGMKQVRDLLKMLSVEYGITIFMSSHILSEVEAIADTIGIISHGEMKGEISMKEISEKNRAYIEVVAEDVRKAAYVLADKLGLSNFKIMDGNAIRVYDGQIMARDLSKELALQDVGVLSIVRQSESLEDYFLKITEEEGKCGN